MKFHSPIEPPGAPSIHFLVTSYGLLTSHNLTIRCPSPYWSHCMETASITSPYVAKPHGAQQNQPIWTHFHYL